MKNTNLKKMLIAFICLICFFTCYAQTIGEHYYLNSLTIRDGLSQNTVYDILQDKAGFMWFGTKDGLNRYDGSSFKIFKYDIYEISQELREDAVQIAGLKRFLLDYTLIKEREAIEVHLFEEYLIFAQMLGIAKKVAKQFSELYPDLVEQSCFYSYDNFYFVNA